MGSLIVKEIPDDIKRNFKLRCVSSGTTIREAVIDWMAKEGQKGLVFTDENAEENEAEK